MKFIVDILCILTSVACAVLLIRGFKRTGVRLLLWSGLCFGLFGFGNVVLLVDTLTGPELDLTLWRKLPSLVGVALLVGGMILEDAG